MTTIRILCDAKEMMKVRRRFAKSGTFFMRSTHSTYIPKLGTKYILHGVVTDWPDKWGEILPRSPGEIARIELNRAFPDLKRVGWRRSQVRLFDWRWPMACLREYQGQGVYVDLVSAYWQIYRNLWLNVRFPAGAGTLDLRPVADVLEHNKRARNAVIGLCASRKMSATKKGKPIKVSTQNNFLSPNLWAVVQGVLNEIASLAVRCGAIYVMSDGYIFPIESQVNGFLSSLEFLGIAYRKICDYVVVKGWQSYSIGAHKATHLFKQGLAGRNDLISINLPNEHKPLSCTWFTFIGSRIVREMRKNNELAQAA